MTADITKRPKIGYNNNMRA